MIIVLKGANFSASNIGTLSTWRITRSLGVGASYEGPTSVDKEGTLTATVTIAEGYELGTAGVTITMSGEVISDATNIQDSIIYISIPVVTGNVVIKVPTVNLNAGEDDQVTMTSLFVDYTQGNTTIFEAQELDDLRRYLTVQASYSDGTNVDVDDYVLSGTLQSGTSTITVSKDNCSTTFTVLVTEFTLPDGYTQYDYIETKSDQSINSIPQDKFIWLPAFENINALSLEATLGQKPDITISSLGVLGARPAPYSDPPTENANLGYCIYWLESTEDDGLRISARNLRLKMPLTGVSTDKIKAVLDNPETSPFTVTINNEIKFQQEWTTAGDTVLSTKISLFNNIPAENTSSMSMNHSVRIGDLLFRDSTGECVAYFTPCVDSNKRIGMYDQISKTFYTATTTSAVIIGNSSVLYQVGNW